MINRCLSRSLRPLGQLSKLPCACVSLLVHGRVRSCECACLPNAWAHGYDLARWACGSKSLAFFACSFAATKEGGIETFLIVSSVVPL